MGYKLFKAELMRAYRTPGKDGVVTFNPVRGYRFNVKLACSLGETMLDLGVHNAGGGKTWYLQDNQTGLLLDWAGFPTRAKALEWLAEEVLGDPCTRDKLGKALDSPRAKEYRELMGKGALVWSRM